jgi:NADH:ubiquinone oxidoreductase subunit
MSLGTRLFTFLHGEAVGSDEFGNRYYLDRRTKGAKRERRWVLYKGTPEASRVPPEWQAWLHGNAQQPPSVAKPDRKPWQKPYVPNLTGTAQAYLPPGHTLRGGQRPKATGDYEPWTPA